MWKGAALRGRLACFAIAVALAAAPGQAEAAPEGWRAAWPNTDFAKHSVDLSEIRSGGPPKDGIPSIDNPQFVAVAEMDELAATEPVIGLAIDGEARAYPLRVLTWHEIINDEVGGVPVAVTYCPLCNAAIVFDRRLDGRLLDFGTTGKLRKSDLVMYDRQTESWWQQFLGEAIVGELTGAQLRVIPARLESWERFARRHPQGRVLVPNDPHFRSYGRNPYPGYDSKASPSLFDGELPEKMPAMARVVVVEGEAWSLELLRAKGRIEAGDLVLEWQPGQSSALDTGSIAQGRDVGNVVVRRVSSGDAVDVPYDVTFAFVFHAFHPQGRWHLP